MVWGSNNLTTFDGATQLSGMVDYVDYLNPVEGASFKELECDSTVAYQRVFVQKQSDDQPSCGNYAEIEFYGWSDDDLAVRERPMFGNRQIAVSWNCTGTPDEFIVERQVDGGAWAVLQPVITQNGSSYSFADSAVEYYSTYAYRVTARYEAFDVSSVSSVASAKCVEPMNLAVSYSDMSQNFYAVLNWENCATISGRPVAVYRSQAPDVWTKIATVAAGTLTYTDMYARVYGVHYQYRIAPDVTGALKPSNIVDYYRVRRLDVRGENGYPVSTVATVVTAWKQNDDGWNSFDGRTDTYSSMNQFGSPHFGLDFGDMPVYVGLVRILPRQGALDTEHLNRCDGLTAYGTNTSGDWGKTDAVSVSVPADRADKQSWINLAGIPSGPWKIVYFWNQTWQGNSAEIEIYGWTDADKKRGFMLIIR